MTKKTIKYQNSALLIIDVQNDFLQGGSLEVANANKIIEPILHLMKLGWSSIIASKDWHYENHISFASNHDSQKVFSEIKLKCGTKQILWPKHCIQNSFGAEIHQDIPKYWIDEIVYKGKNPKVDSYSAFFDNNRLEKTNLDSILKSKIIEHVYVVGLARDYCVKWTAMDAQLLGYQAHVILDATKAVNPELKHELLRELEQAQVKTLHLKDLI